VNRGKDKDVLHIKAANRAALGTEAAFFIPPLPARGGAEGDNLTVYHPGGADQAFGGWGGTGA
jgi:hypothetical protein